VRVVGQFAVAALYERRSAVTDRRYKDQIWPTTGRGAACDASECLSYNHGIRIGKFTLRNTIVREAGDG